MNVGSVVQIGGAVRHSPLPSLTSYTQNGIDDDDPDKNSALRDAHKFAIGGFIGDGQLAWRAVGSTIEVFDPLTCSRLAAWTFGAILRNASPRVTCVCGLGIGTVTHIVIGVNLGSENPKGMVGVLSLRRSRIIRAFHFRHEVTNITMVTGGERVVDPSTLVSQLRLCQGLVAVATAQAHLYLVDLALDLGDDITSDEIGPASTVDICPSDSKASFRRNEVVARGFHPIMELTDNGGNGKTFQLLGPDENVLYEAPIHTISISSLMFIPQLASLAVGFSFGSFQIINLNLITIDCASPFEENRPPVFSFAYQEPENDPRSHVYLWVCRSFASGVNQHPPSSISEKTTCSMYAMSYDKKEWIEGHGLWYQGLLSMSPRFDFEAVGGIGERVAHSLPSQIVSAMTVVGTSPSSHLITSPLAPLMDNALAASDEETEPVPELSLCLFCWEAQVLDQGKMVATHYIAIFDINQWYQSQMPSRLRLSGHDLCPYMSFHTLDKVPTSLGERLIGGAAHKGSWSRHTTRGHSEKLWYPSSLSYEFNLLTSEGLATYRCPSVQQSAICNLLMQGPATIVNPRAAFSACVFAGVVAPLQDRSAIEGGNSTVSEREQLLNVALEYHLLPLLAQCVVEFSSGKFSYLGCSAELLLDWAWGKLRTIKRSSDSLCMPLFTSGEEGEGFQALSSQNLSALHENLTYLSHIKNLVHSIREHAGDVTSTSAGVLEGKTQVVSLVHLHLQVVLWFYHCGLLPQCAPEEAVDDKCVPFPADALSALYFKRRKELESIKSLEDARDLLLIDSIMAECGDLLLDVWDTGTQGGTGNDLGGAVYPPPSLHALLSMYLLPGIPTHTKHRVVQYVFLDLVSLLSENYTNVLEELVKFPSSFSLSPSLIKLTQAFWLIDNKDFQAGLSVLLDPLVNPSDITLAQHRKIIKAFLYQREESLALTYSHMRQSPRCEAEDIRLNLSLLLANGRVREAFHYQRAFRNTDSGKELLHQLFRGCEHLGRLESVVHLPLTTSEEEEFVSFLKASSNPLAADVLLIFLLQQSRYKEISSVCDLRRDCSNNLMRNKARTALVQGYMSHLPDVRAQMINNSVKSRLPKWTLYSKPQPLSAHIRQSTLHTPRSKATAFRVPLERSGTTSKSPGASLGTYTPFRSMTQRRRNLKWNQDLRTTPRDEESSQLESMEETPIVFPKSYTADVVKNSMVTTPTVFAATSSMSSMQVPGAEEEAGRPVLQNDVARILDILLRNSMNLGSTPHKEKEPVCNIMLNLTTSEVVSLLKTPPVRHVNPSRQPQQESFLETPQSILKVRKILQQSVALSESESPLPTFPTHRVSAVKSTQDKSFDTCISEASSLTPKQLRFDLPSGRRAEEELEGDLYIPPFPQKKRKRSPSPPQNSSPDVPTPRKPLPRYHSQLQVSPFTRSSDSEEVDNRSVAMAGLSALFSENELLPGTKKYRFTEVQNSSVIKSISKHIRSNQSPTNSIEDSSFHSVESYIEHSPIGKSPTKSWGRSPDKSPTKKWTLSPDKSLNKSWSRSPVKSPTESISHSPDKSPTKSYSHSSDMSPAKNLSISPDKSPTKSRSSSPTKSPRSLAYSSLDKFSKVRTHLSSNKSPRSESLSESAQNVGGISPTLLRTSEISFSGAQPLLEESKSLSNSVSLSSKSSDAAEENFPSQTAFISSCQPLLDIPVDSFKLSSEQASLGESRDHRSQTVSTSRESLTTQTITSSNIYLDVSRTSIAHSNSTSSSVEVSASTVLSETSSISSKQPPHKVPAEDTIPLADQSREKESISQDVQTNQNILNLSCGLKFLDSEEEEDTKTAKSYSLPVRQVDTDALPTVVSKTDTEILPRSLSKADTVILSSEDEQSDYSRPSTENLDSTSAKTETKAVSELKKADEQLDTSSEPLSKPNTELAEIENFPSDLANVPTFPLTSKEREIVDLMLKGDHTFSFKNYHMFQEDEDVCQKNDNKFPRNDKLLPKDDAKVLKNSDKDSSLNKSYANDLVFSDDSFNDVELDQNQPMEKQQNEENQQVNIIPREIIEQKSEIQLAVQDDKASGEDQQNQVNQTGEEKSQGQVEQTSLEEPPQDQTVQTSPKEPLQDQIVKMSSKEPPQDPTVQTILKEPQQDQIVKTSSKEPPQDQTVQISSKEPQQDQIVKTSSKEPPQDQTVQTSSKEPQQDQIVKMSSKEPPQDQTVQTILKEPHKDQIVQTSSEESNPEDYNSDDSGKTIEFDRSHLGTIKEQTILTKHHTESSKEIEGNSQEENKDSFGCRNSALVPVTSANRESDHSDLPNSQTVMVKMAISNQEPVSCPVKPVELNVLEQKLQNSNVTEPMRQNIETAVQNTTILSLETKVSRVQGIMKEIDERLRAPLHLEINLDNNNICKEPFLETPSSDEGRVFTPVNPEEKCNDAVSTPATQERVHNPPANDVQTPSRGSTLASQIDEKEAYTPSKMSTQPTPLKENLLLTPTRKKMQAAPLEEEIMCTPFRKSIILPALQEEEEEEQRTPARKTQRSSTPLREDTPSRRSRQLSGIDPEAIIGEAMLATPLRRSQRHGSAHNELQTTPAKEVPTPTRRRKTSETSDVRESPIEGEVLVTPRVRKGKGVAQTPEIKEESTKTPECIDAQEKQKETRLEPQTKSELLTTPSRRKKPHLHNILESTTTTEELKSPSGRKTPVVGRRNLNKTPVSRPGTPSRRSARLSGVVDSLGVISENNNEAIETPPVQPVVTNDTEFTLTTDAELPLSTQITPRSSPQATNKKKTQKTPVRSKRKSTNVTVGTEPLLETIREDSELSCSVISHNTLNTPMDYPTGQATGIPLEKPIPSKEETVSEPLTLTKGKATPTRSLSSNKAVDINDSITTTATADPCVISTEAVDSVPLARRTRRSSLSFISSETSPECSSQDTPDDHKDSLLFANYTMITPRGSAASKGRKSLVSRRSTSNLTLKAKLDRRKSIKSLPIPPTLDVYIDESHQKLSSTTASSDEVETPPTSAVEIGADVVDEVPSVVDDVLNVVDEVPNLVDNKPQSALLQNDHSVMNEDSVASLTYTTLTPITSSAPKGRKSLVPRRSTSNLTLKAKLDRRKSIRSLPIPPALDLHLNESSRELATREKSSGITPSEEGFEKPPSVEVENGGSVVDVPLPSPLKDDHSVPIEEPNKPSPDPIYQLLDAPQGERRPLNLTRRRGVKVMPFRKSFPTALKMNSASGQELDKSPKKKLCKGSKSSSESDLEENVAVHPKGQQEGFAFQDPQEIVSSSEAISEVFRQLIREHERMVSENFVFSPPLSLNEKKRKKLSNIKKLKK